MNPVSYTHLDVYKRQVAACPDLVDRPTEGFRETPGVRRHPGETFFYERQEVAVEPRDPGELAPVGDLVQSDPQPELVRRKAVPAFETDDVRPDVRDDIAARPGPLSVLFRRRSRIFGCLLYTSSRVDVEVSQVPEALGDIEPVAHHEIRRDAEPYVPEVEIGSLTTFLHEQGTHFEARRLAGEQVPSQIRQGEAAVDDVPVSYTHLDVYKRQGRC